MERLFIRWIKYPDDVPIHAFWESWLKKFPEMQDTVHAAAELIRASSDWPQENDLSEDEVGSIWTRIRSSIGQVKEMDPLQSRIEILKFRLFYYRWYLIGLVLVGLVLLLALFS